MAMVQNSTDVGSVPLQNGARDLGDSYGLQESLAIWEISIYIRSCCFVSG
jgi:hypothetical protein